MMFWLIAEPSRSVLFALAWWSSGRAAGTARTESPDDRGWRRRRPAGVRRQARPCVNRARTTAWCWSARRIVSSDPGSAVAGVAVTSATVAPSAASESAASHGEGDRRGRHRRC